MNGWNCRKTDYGMNEWLELSCDYKPRMSIACLCSSPRLLPLHTDNNNNNNNNNNNTDNS